MASGSDRDDGRQAETQGKHDESSDGQRGFQKDEEKGESEGRVFGLR